MCSKQLTLRSHSLLPLHRKIFKNVSPLKFSNLWTFFTSFFIFPLRMYRFEHETFQLFWIFTLEFFFYLKLSNLMFKSKCESDDNEKSNIINLCAFLLFSTFRKIFGQSHEVWLLFLHCKYIVRMQIEIFLLDFNFRGRIRERAVFHIAIINT